MRPFWRKMILAGLMAAGGGWSALAPAALADGPGRDDHGPGVRQHDRGSRGWGDRDRRGNRDDDPPGLPPGARGRDRRDGHDEGRD